MTVKNVAQNVGKGLAAGFAGTAAMTISSTIEQKLRHRAASTAPADATAKVLGISEFKSRAARNRFSNISHWGYGTGWGAVHGLLASVGLGPAAATAAHGAAVWSNEQVMLPALAVAPPGWLWGRKELAIDAWHHLVYAAGTGIAYELIETRG
jgi:hypothetical protein